MYAGPILGFHVSLVIVTNVLLCQVRDVADRYQEQKYVAMASASMVEILLVGIPVLVSVKNSASATFIVLTAVVALDDIGECHVSTSHAAKMHRSNKLTICTCGSRSMLYFLTEGKLPEKGTRKRCAVR